MYRLSRGVPRLINVICDRALLGAYSLDRHRVSGALVRRAAAEVFGRAFAAFWLPWAAAAGLAALLAAVTATLWALGPWSPGAHGAGTAGANAVVALAPAAAPATVVAPPPAPTLAQLLAAHTAETDTDSAFGKLFTLWGAKYQADGTDPCTQASRLHLECLAKRGSFGQLRVYNHPAILMLSDAGGASHQVVLSGLDDQHARLELGGAQAVGLGELSHLLARRLRDAVAPGKLAGAAARGRHARRGSALAAAEPASTWRTSTRARRRAMCSTRSSPGWCAISSAHTSCRSTASPAARRRSRSPARSPVPTHRCSRPAGRTADKRCPSSSTH